MIVEELQRIVSNARCMGVRISLPEVYLEGADLRGADLEGADLRGADLRGADLEGADLRGAYLRGADLRGADLTGAYLRGADLTGAYLREAHLREADLTGAYLRGADLRNTEVFCFQIFQWAAFYHKGYQYEDGDYLKTGCLGYSLGYWMRNYKRIGKEHHYSDSEISQHYQMMLFINNHIKYA